jgi:L-asparaginase
MLIITTGGTIDSHYDLRQDMVAPLRHSALPAYIQSLGIDADYIHISTKDARDIDTKDLDQLRDAIYETNHTSIIVTHGLQTIVDTMRYLDQHISGRTIILVGARIPLGEAWSDGGFHLSTAIVHRNDLSNGIYLSR